MIVDFDDGDLVVMVVMMVGFVVRVGVVVIMVLI